MENKNVYLSKAAEEVREMFRHENDVKEMIINFRTNIVTTQQKSLKYNIERVFFYDIEAYLEEKIGHRVHSSVGYIPVSKLSNSMVYKGLADPNINNLNGNVNICKREGCIDRILNQIYKKCKVDPNVIKGKLL